MEIFVPGRLCILGEHTDWAVCFSGNGHLDYCPDAGACIVATTNEGIYCRVEALTEPVFEFIYRSRGPEIPASEVERFSVPFEVSVLTGAAADPDNFFRYVAGTAAVLLERHPPPVGFGIRIDNYLSTLPPRRGLSSSAAVCVSVVKAYAAALSIQMDKREIMDIAYRGERLTPSMCGRLDQCCAMEPGSVAVIRFTPDDAPASLQHIPTTAAFHFVVGDLGADKDTTAILQHLRMCFDAPTALSSGAESFPPGAEHVRAYVSTNGSRVAACAEGLAKGDHGMVASAMEDAQCAFDAGAILCAPHHLTSPALRRVLQNDAVRARVLAGKGVGSQGDGSVQLLCADEADQLAAAELLRTVAGCRHVFTLTIPASDAPQSVSAC